MFESWCDARTLRVFCPPRPVLVDIHQLDPHAGRPYGFSPTEVPLHTRANGARLEAVMPGDQQAWLQLFDGQWRALISLPVSSANGRSALTVTHWVPPGAFRLRVPPQ